MDVGVRGDAGRLEPGHEGVLMPFLSSLLHSLCHPAPAQTLEWVTPIERWTW